VTPGPAGPTLQGFIDKYLERSSTPISTNDRGCLRKFTAFAVDGAAPGDTQLADLTEDTIETFFGSLRTAGVAASTRKVRAGHQRNVPVGRQEGLSGAEPHRGLRNDHPRETCETRSPV
jgi:hypothetical protein